MDARLNRISLAVGAPGLLLRILGGLIVFSGGNEEEAVIAAGVGGLIWLLGSVLLIVGLCFYAEAKGRRGMWGLMGFLGLLGLIVLAALPDLHAEAMRQQAVAAGEPMPEEPTVKGLHRRLAIWSIVLGSLAWVFCFGGFFFSIPGVIVGHIARFKVHPPHDPPLAGDEERRSVRKLAMIGLIIGYAAIVFTVVFIVFVIIAMLLEQ